MFRLFRLKPPPHGWNAVAWELGIVTLGVIIALAAQQWAEGLSWRGKIEATKSALRDELAEHFDYAVEFRVVHPCLQAQLDTIRNRVLSSGPTLKPAPLYKEPDAPNDYVLRMPGKFYPTDAWEEAISDGVVQRFEPPMRRQLAGHYVMLADIQRMNAENSESETALKGLAHPLPLDPSARYSIVREVELLRGRLQYLDRMNGQLIDYIKNVGMLPPEETARTVTERYGTYRFCKLHGLPMRPFHDAMQAVPN